MPKKAAKFGPTVPACGKRDHGSHSSHSSSSNCWGGTTIGPGGTDTGTGGGTTGTAGRV